MSLSHGDKPWPQAPVGNKDHANAAVVVIGAGISGICTAIDLIKRNNCRNFIVVEKSAGLGGTWHDNKYPGCCCDVWSMLYSLSFAQNSDWTRTYPGQEEILAYLIRVAQEYDLFQHIRFNTTVEDARWDDAEQKWRTRVTTASGSKDAEFSPEYTITSDFLVSAVGQLNVPKWPEINGVDTFEGKKMHSARWDWSYDMTDKKIAIIGNGCTSVQIAPEAVKVAKHVTIFQRTPNWCSPRLDQAVSPAMRKILKYLPPVRWRIRAGMMDFRESSHQIIAGNPDAAQELRNLHKEMLETQLPDRKDLWEKLTPKYNPGCKRIIFTDDYFPALARPNVTLETRAIDRIEGKTVKIRGDDGEVIDAPPGDFDMLVCATGFKTVDFMHPIAMYGRNGRSLKDIWSDGTRAYNGTCLEDMPNFGMLYGPNTNLGHNSIILMIEAQSRYINGLIKLVIEARKEGKSLSMSPKKSVVEKYNKEIQSELQNSVFNDPNCNSWYKDEKGNITNNWSRTVVQYQKMLSNVNFDDYEIEGSGKDLVGEKDTLHVGRVREETYISDTALITLGAISTAALAAGWILRNTKLLSSIRVR